MTNKYLSGAYPSGYSLNNTKYAGLVVDLGASVGGSGVYSKQTATVTNLGSISANVGNSRGVRLEAGGAVTNGAVNDTSAVIYGYFGVGADGGAATIANYATIDGHIYGLDLAEGGTVTNGAVGDTTALIGGENGGVDVHGRSGTVFNFATIQGFADGSVAVYLAHGGSVTNGSATDAKAVIQGVVGVTTFAGQAVTVTNFGTIAGSGGTALDLKSASDRLIVETGAVFNGALVAAGGTLELAGGADTITGLNVSGVMSGATALNFSGVGALHVDAGATLTLAGTNGVRTGQLLTVSGSLINTGAFTGAGGAFGIYLNTGGDLTNGSSADTSALISAYNGVTALGGANTVANFGTIDGGGANGVILQNGPATVTNGAVGHTAALIEAATGVFGQTATVTIANFGTIDGAKYGGVFLDRGGSVTNGSATDTKALIEGAAGVTTYAGQAVTVTNFGTIAGTGGTAVDLKSNFDGLVVEAGAAFEGKLIGGAGTLELAGGADTISGLGASGVMTGATSASFSGFRSYVIDAGATLTLAGTNALSGDQTCTVFGSLTNTGAFTVTSPVFGIVLEPGASLINGSVADTSALISTSLALSVGGTNTVANFGTISSSADVAVGLDAGASLTNGAINDTSALISGNDGIGSAGGPNTVINDGTIIGLTSNGVFFAGGGMLTNGTSKDTAALIEGKTGVLVRGVAALANFGTISGAKYGGVFLDAGGSVGNGSATDPFAVIEGLVGVTTYPGQAATVTNFGTIDGTGGTAVDLKSSSDRLIVESSAVFQGALVGGGGTLELAKGTGTVSGLGKSFTGFAAYQVDAGGTWTLSGTNALANGTTLTDKGTLIDTGALSLSAGAKLAVANAGVLQIQGVVANAGTIDVASTGSTTELRILAAGATLSGAGTVTMAGAKAAIAGASSAATLTNVNDTIVGEGFFGLSQLTLDNQAAGVIEATGDLVLGTAPKTLVNAGRLEAIAGGTLVIASTTVANSGTILAAGGKVELQASDIVGGTLAGTGAGLLTVNSGSSTLDGSKSAVGLAGEVQVDPGTTLTAMGSLAGTGSLNLFSGRLVIGAAGLTLSGKGQVNLDDATANIVIGASATLANVNDRISGAGDLGDGSMILVNEAAGIITDTQAKGLTIDTGTHVITNAGTIAGGIGGVTVASGIANTGELFAGAGTLTLDGAVTGTGSARIVGGTLVIGAHPFAETVTFAGKGTLELKDSVAFTGKVAGLSTTGTNALDLADIAFKSGTTKASYSGTTASGVLTVTDGTHTAKISLAGNYLAATFTLSNDGHGGTKVVDPTTSAHPKASLHQYLSAVASFGAPAGGWLHMNPDASGSSQTGLATPKA